jgi:hypothetical protein
MAKINPIEIEEISSAANCRLRIGEMTAKAMFCPRVQRKIHQMVASRHFI